MPPVQNIVNKKIRGLELIGYNVNSNGKNTYVKYYWRKNAQIGYRFMAIDLFEGDLNRVLHLPSFVSYPVKRWEVGDIIEETMVYELSNHEELELLMIHIPTIHSVITNKNDIIKISDQEIIESVKIIL